MTFARAIFISSRYARHNLQEPWEPEDTLGILRVLCYQLNHGGQHPAIRQLLVCLTLPFPLASFSL